GMEDGDLYVAVAGDFRVHAAGEGDDVASGQAALQGLEPALDELRRHLGARMGLIDADRHAWAWITEFPLFDWDPDLDRLVSAHHPFTMPHADDLERLREAVAAGAPLTGEESQ